MFFHLFCVISFILHILILPFMYCLEYHHKRCCLSANEILRRFFFYFHRCICVIVIWSRIYYVCLTSQTNECRLYNSKVFFHRANTNPKNAGLSGSIAEGMETYLSDVVIDSFSPIHSFLFNNVQRALLATERNSPSSSV